MKPFSHFSPAVLSAFLLSCGSSTIQDFPNEVPIRRQHISEVPSSRVMEEGTTLETILELIRVIRGQGFFNISPRALQLEETGLLFLHDGNSYVLTDDAIGRFPELFQERVNPQAHLQGAMQYQFGTFPEFGNFPALFMCSDAAKSYSIFMTSAPAPAIPLGDSSQLRPGTRLYGVGHSVGQRFVTEGFVARPQEFSDIALAPGEFLFYSANFHGGMPLFAQDDEDKAYLVGIFCQHLPEYNVSKGMGITEILRSIERQHCLAGLETLPGIRYRTIMDE